jgi:hypothetical protein
MRNVWERRAYEGTTVRLYGLHTGDGELGAESREPRTRAYDCTTVREYHLNAECGRRDVKSSRNPRAYDSTHVREYGTDTKCRMRNSKCGILRNCLGDREPY